MIAPARAAAFDILTDVARHQGNSDELLRAPSVDALSAPDRNLTTSLVMGTLRWQLLLDRRISELLTRPDTKLALPVQIALRLGAFQLWFLDRIPPHAAIGDSVELAKRAEGKFAAGMVNAVLRKIARESRPVLSASTAIAAHPEWLVARWAKHYGSAAAEAICLYNQQPPPVSLRLVGAHAEASLLGEGIELAPGELVASARRVLRGDVTATAAYRTGAIRIQDEGSQLVAEFAGRGSRILDLCAAPGGKTAILAELNPEAEITACDISARRLGSMQRLLERAPGAERIRYLQADAATVALKPEYDLVLCDAPCSGTGTVGRNPEVRHRITAADLERQQARQIAILSNALNAVVPGGRLVYSTCSLEPEENEDISEQIAALKSLVMHTGRTLRTIPGRDQCDGFFATELCKK